MNKKLLKFFSEKEVQSTEDFYIYTEGKKVVVFVPVEFVEKLTADMSNAGAGLIGNYEMCSFRTEGTGTFKPGKKASPYSGKKNKLSYQIETKLEMECSPEDLNRVISALIKNHPYDEIAYEIYDFKKREKKPSGIILDLRSKITFAELMGKLNNNIRDYKAYPEDDFKRLVFTNSEKDDDIIESARFINSDCVLVSNKKTFKLIKI